ncbi:hypothetical protein SESBI_10876 [Sesbania bispinosa]|nr:hypothetical protein SESBI_10876 [Sesbania bispinosa]
MKAIWRWYGCSCRESSQSQREGSLHSPILLDPSPKHRLLKVGIPEFLNGIGNGVESHVAKLESEIGDFRSFLSLAPSNSRSLVFLATSACAGARASMSKMPLLAT